VKNKLLKNFGKYLLRLRESQGLSQDDVIAKAKSGAAAQILSKSTLSLYEQGRIHALRPAIAHILATIYKVPYQELVSRWTKEVFATQSSIASEAFILSASEDSCTLRGPSENNQMTIISVDELRRTQENVPVGTEIGVATLSFLDNDIYFEMVSENIRRGVKYFYVLPEDDRITYVTLLSRIAQKYPEIARNLDGKRTHYIARHPTDFPFNYVVYVYPKGQIQGYVGLLYDKRVQYFLKADAGLSLRMYHAFSLAISLAEDKELHSRLHDLFRLASEKSLGKKQLSLTLTL
jgi:transcriptional regulator with XRE-family HTH domain